MNSIYASVSSMRYFANTGISPKAIPQMQCVMSEPGLNNQCTDLHLVASTQHLQRTQWDELVHLSKSLSVISQEEGGAFAEWL